MDISLVRDFSCLRNFCIPALCVRRKKATYKEVDCNIEAFGLRKDASCFSYKYVSSTIIILQLEVRRAECKWLASNPHEISCSTVTVNHTFRSSVLCHRSQDCLLLGRTLLYTAVSTCFAPSYPARNVQNTKLPSFFVITFTSSNLP